MSPLLVSAVVVLSLLTLGCLSGGASAAVKSGQAPAENWRLTFALSGGIAGLNRALELTNAGAATATDRRRNRQVSRQVPPDELREINRLIASTASADRTNRPSSCRDCFGYDIDLQAPGRQVTIHVSDDSLADPTIGPLLQALSGLLNRLLAEP